MTKNHFAADSNYSVWPMVICLISCPSGITLHRRTEYFLVILTFGNKANLCKSIGSLQETRWHSGNTHARLPGERFCHTSWAQNLTGIGWILIGASQVKDWSERELCLLEWCGLNRGKNKQTNWTLSLLKPETGDNSRSHLVIDKCKERIKWKSSVKWKDQIRMERRHVKCGRIKIAMNNLSR